MNNETIYEIKIKYRGDHVYDIYMNGKWVASRGSYENATDIIKELMEEHQ